MTRVNIHTAKTHLSRLIETACAGDEGDEIVISRGDVTVVRLVPIAQVPRRRAFGAMRGRASIDDRFFEPLPEDELAAWER